MLIKRLFFAILTVFLSSTILSAGVIPEAEIDSISTKNLDAIGKNYTLEIIFTVKKANIKNWKFGFYMPRKFSQLLNIKNELNPNLKMSISNLSDSKTTEDLKYFYSKSGRSLSAGYTSVFKPSKTFELKKGEKYIITLANSNQWSQGNYSSLPQTLFLLYYSSNASTCKPKVINLSSTPINYKIDGYDQIKISEQIKIRLNNYIKRSNNNTTLADNYSIVPTPVSIEKTNTGFDLKKFKSINIYSECSKKLTKSTIKQLKTALKSDLKLKSRHMKEMKKNIQSGFILKKLNNNNIIKNNPEGYRLIIDNNTATIESFNSAGFFYGYQTLRNLWNTTNGKLPGLTITDYPRFKYRGVLIDVSRHFHSIKTLKRLINVMASQKLNSLHIHFADDEGWRLELPGMNFLKNGSFRGMAKDSYLTPAMMIQANLDITNYNEFLPSSTLIKPEYAQPQTLYKGIYKKSEIKKLIKYANEREITIIPEIDLPGHARALVYSKPKVFINNDDKSKYVSEQGYFDDVIPVCLYTASNKQGKIFTKTMDKIIRTTAKLFNKQTTLYHTPNEVSVGGDEVSAQAWTNDLSAVGVWKDKSALSKSIYFFNLLKKNNPVVLSGWQQFVQYDNGDINKTEATPAKDTAHVLVWNPSKDGIAQAQTLANNDYPTVLAFADNTYFDLTYSPDIWEPGYYWAGKYLDTNSALVSSANASKVLKGLSEDKQKNILGVEGTLWSENIPTERHLFYMALPKMTGLAESAWSAENITVDKDFKVNWTSLTKRLGKNNKGFLGYLNKVYGIEYRGYPNGISKEL
ncbi:MAG TPA: family 20 glycosylhydrolase [Victivallales bacterium]|nr:family 20 glycosylhydrolase [Victivallales bacterium]